MENKTPERTPTKPGIAEAIHPEIGNGVIWEANRHQFLLRNPDPTKDLDSLLDIEPEQSSNIDLTTPEVENELPIIAARMDTSQGAPEKVILEMQADNQPDTKDESSQDETDKKEKGKTDRKKKSKNKDAETAINAETLETLAGDNDQAKLPKAGKLVRKAAKSARRKEEEEKKAGTPIIALTESTLSPYTQWLKGLRGSDYVHPYDDDFAFVQGTGPAKEGISETYADLLAAQGYKEQAIEMYMKLMEKYPEKSGFFAAKIEALQ